MWQEHQSHYSPVARSVLLCSYHVLTSSVRYLSTHARPNGIYLLNTRNALGDEMFNSLYMS